MCVCLRAARVCAPGLACVALARRWSALGGGLARRAAVPEASGRAIRTAWLSASLRVHLRPIDVVVYHGPWGDLV